MRESLFQVASQALPFAASHGKACSSSPCSTAFHFSTSLRSHGAALGGRGPSLSSPILDGLGLIELAIAEFAFSSPLGHSFDRKAQHRPSGSSR